MCGFVTIRGGVTKDELRSMAKTVAGRGPDGSGEFIGEGFSAIHHRLSIIGPDKRGKQPMSVDEVTVCFNGCIYNYRELRKQLEKDGVQFQSDTDTEVLPHLYRRFGLGMFNMLSGMFAMVLWDARDHVMVLARDAFGEKPLYVCEQDGRIGAASSLSAFEQGKWRLSPDISSVYSLLVRMRVDAPATLYQEVNQLPPGCYAVSDGESFRLSRFAMLPEPDQAPDVSGDELETVVAGMLDEAFIARTVSDKPMGVFLSGGVDSSLIAESLARQMSEPLHTFSVRFTDGPADYDESAHAAEVAAHIGSQHQVLEVSADAHESLDALAAAFDQPVANSAALPTFLISREAKKHVDVALSGVGGDEIFGGYPRYLGARWHASFSKLPGKRALHALASLAGESSGSRNLRRRLKRFLKGIDAPLETAYAGWMRTTEAGRLEMFTAGGEGNRRPWGANVVNAGGMAGLIERFGTVNGVMAYDALTYLPDDLLAMGDRMSMAHALELRAPFLDWKLYSTILTLDSRLKVDGPPWNEGLKLMLKSIAKKRLPAPVVDRPKQGFMAPVKHWLRGEFAGDIEALCNGAPLAGLLKPEFVRREWERHQGGEDRSDILWAVLLLDRWMQQHGWSFDGG